MSPRALLLVPVLMLFPACSGSTGDAPDTKSARAGDEPQPDDKADDTPDDKPDAPAKSDGTAPTSVEEPGPPQNDVGADELHELEGQSEAAIVKKFGEPESQREFTMADCCTEFSVELLNTYPPDKGHDEVEIREWTWDYEGYKLTVWLHQKAGEWQVLETSRYSDDVEF